jgi:hypothetical protein
MSLIAIASYRLSWPGGSRGGLIQRCTLHGISRGVVNSNDETSDRRLKTNQ